MPPASSSPRAAASWLALEQLGGAAPLALIRIGNRHDTHLGQSPQGIGIAGGGCRPDQYAVHHSLPVPRRLNASRVQW